MTPYESAVNLSGKSLIFLITCAIYHNYEEVCSTPWRRVAVSAIPGPLLPIRTEAR